MLSKTLTENTGAVGTAPASIPTDKGGADTLRKKVHQEFKDRGAALGAQLTEEQIALEGSKSGDVAFVCAVGNPKQKQDRVSKGQSVPCYKPVGYKFKALADIKVPVLPLKDGCKTLIDVDVQAETEVAVKKGQTFVCNLREYGALISRPEYGGTFDGEGKRVYLGVTFSGERLDPYPILKAAEGSVKETMDLIADVTKNADGTDKYTIKPEYEEKFAVLLKPRKIERNSAGGAKASEAGQSAKNVARALSDWYSNH